MSVTSLSSQSVNFASLLKTASGLPGVKIDRTEFLTNTLRPHVTEAVLKQALLNNPAAAGIGIDKINKIADSCITFETNKVTAVSFVAGIPGGLAMAGTIPADLAQYFGHILRILQKLIYLYGWQELFDKDGQLDDETANLLTLFTGIMFGVNGATSTITKIVDSATQKVAKSLANKALTKGAIYPIVKKVAAALGIRMTKQIFANGVSKVVPIIGGLASGGLTYATYRPMAVKLRNHLATLKFADPDFYSVNNISEVIDVEDFVDFEAPIDIEE